MHELSLSREVNRLLSGAGIPGREAGSFCSSLHLHGEGHVSTGVGGENALPVQGANFWSIIIGRITAAIV